LNYQPNERFQVTVILTLHRVQSTQLEHMKDDKSDIWQWVELCPALQRKDRYCLLTSSNY